MGINREDFYQAHLDRVSRSFAICIAELDSPLREWTGLSYILCRIVDTLEDSEWPKRELKIDALKNLRSVISHPHQNLEPQFWKAHLPSSISASEQLLVEDSDIFFKDLGELPNEVRVHIEFALFRLIDGMIHFLNKSTDGKNLHLQTLTEVNQYCFFVAGIVGELMTELVQLSTPDFLVSDQCWQNSIHFGLFLQKINLLKDQSGDEEQGRFLLPSREDCLVSLRANAQGALDYILSLPLVRNDYRLFCAWALFLGLASLPWIEKSWRQKLPLKISRIESALLLARVKLQIGSNEGLQKIFDELLILPDPRRMPDENQPEVPSWFREAYAGRIETSALKDLGLF